MRSNVLTLADYRRGVQELYRAIRHESDSQEAWKLFRRTRDELLRTHPETPLTPAQQKAFQGLAYFDYDPAYRVSVSVAPPDKETEYTLDLGEDGQCTLLACGQVQAQIPNGTVNLTLYWVQGYGGGLFLPFGDATNGNQTYGGGRYLYDTVKGADLGGGSGTVVLDFNFAYNPSCAYNPRWVCPLAPEENRLTFPIPAGERVPDLS